MNTTAAAQPTTELGIGLSGQIAHVHKKDAEGLLAIDKVTGQVIPGQHDRPEWAEGLVLAQLAERHIFYTNRLGAQYAAAHSNPEVFAFEDLGWLAVNTNEDSEEAGDEIVLGADDEFRMEVIGQVLGISRDATHDADADGAIAGSTIAVEIAMDNTRTEAELKDFREAQEAGFKAVNE